MISTLPKAKAAPLRYRLAMALYQAAWFVAMPLVWRYFLRRATGDPAYGEHLDERKGILPAGSADVWIHAVSLGEFRSALPVIEGLLANGRRLVITHATPAGRRASHAALKEPIARGQVIICYAPLDRLQFWELFFSTTKPAVGLVFEMEFWPAMTEAAARTGLPLWFVNAQIPEKSFPLAGLVFRVLGAHPVSRSAGVLAKSNRMADRFRALSAPIVAVAGETRFDIAPPQAHVAAGARLKESLGQRSVYAFASVVEGEEQTYLEACKKLAKADPKPLIIWVPRAPEVFDRTAHEIDKAGLRLKRRTEVLDEGFGVVASLDHVDVLLGDSFGEMFFYLTVSDVVSVGGGFVEKGAHNVIEPLALGKPVIVGPHIWTIEFPGREARDEGVLTVCENPDTLAEMLEAARGGSAIAAQDFHKANLGASNRIVEHVEREMERNA